MACPHSSTSTCPDCTLLLSTLQCSDECYLKVASKCVYYDGGNIVQGDIIINTNDNLTKIINELVKNATDIDVSVSFNPDTRELCILKQGEVQNCVLVPDSDDQYLAIDNGVLQIWKPGLTPIKINEVILPDQEFAQEQSDWTETDPDSPTYILHKPTNYWTLENDSQLHPISLDYRVGIGCNPGFKFDVVHDDGRLYFDGTRLGLRDASTNLLIGYLTGQNVTGADDNIALGNFAITRAIGSGNVALGTAALKTVQGNNNTAVGRYALSETDFNDNTAVGYAAGISNYGQGNTVIGAEASNSLKIVDVSVNTSEIVLATSNISGMATSNLIATNSLQVGEIHPMRVTFNGAIPSPYGVLVKTIYVTGKIINSSTIQLSGEIFESRGSGTMTVSLFDKQDNAIAIGNGAQTRGSNQIVLGNSSNTILRANQFIADINDVPEPGDIFVWNSTKGAADWQPASQLVWRAILTSSFVNGCILAANGTGYSQLTGTCGMFQNEGDKTFIVTEACVAKNLFVATRGLQPGGSSTVVTLRKNATNTALQVTIPSGSAYATFSNTTTEVPLQAGDKIALRYVSTAATSLNIFLSNALSLVSSS